MTKNHIKRINAPKRWNILRKDKVFISRPNPGRKLELAVSLNTALKEMLGKTSTTKESKYMIRSQGVLVNGTRRYDEKFPVGFLDVLSLPTIGEHYRLIVNDNNKLTFTKLTEAESKVKISKISTKMQLPGGKLQVNCTDGRNFLMDHKDAMKLATGDTVLYSMPDQKIQESFKLEKGVLAFLYMGRHVGETVKIDDFKAANIIFTLNGQSYETKKSYAFAIGKDKPAITVTEHKAASGHKEAEHKPAAKKHKAKEE